MAERLFSAYQVADLLGVSPMEVAQWIQKGRLPLEHLPNGPVRIREKALVEFLRQQGIDIKAILAKVVLTEKQKQEASESARPARPAAVSAETFTPAPALRPADRVESRVDSLQLPAMAAQPTIEPPAEDAAEPSPQRDHAGNNGDGLEEVPPNRDGLPAAAQPLMQTEAPAPRAQAAPSEPEPQPDPQAESQSPADDSASPTAAEHFDVERPVAEQPSASHAAGQVIQAVLAEALAAQAQQVVLDLDGPMLRLHLRVDGTLIDKPAFTRRLPQGLGGQIVATLKSQAGLAGATDRPEQRDIAMIVKGHDVELRVIYCPTASGERLVLCPKFVIEPASLGELDLSQADASLLRRLVCGSGLIVVAGPPGSGRRDTLLALAGATPAPADCVLVQRRPGGERCCGDITRVVAGGDGKETWVAPAVASLAAQGCKTILVHDVLRKAELAACMEAALAGQLVLASVQARSAVEAMDLLAQAGSDAWELAAGLRAVISQRAGRRLCPHCRVAASLADRSAVAAADLPADWPAYRPAGCEKCHHIGYRGRLGVLSVLSVDRPMAAAIRAGGDADSVAASAAGALAQAAMAKVQQGLLSLDDLAGVLA